MQTKVGHTLKSTLKLNKMQGNRFSNEITPDISVFEEFLRLEYFSVLGECFP